MKLRSQHSLRRAGELSGVGLFSGCDVTLRFLPAPADTGIVFRRTDLAGHPEVPARLDYLTATDRRTSLCRGDARVELTEHVLAALAGLQIDNCVVEIDAPEVPGVDGSCLPFVELLLDAGIEEQGVPRACLQVDQRLTAETDDRRARVSVQPFNQRGLAITYQLDYGQRSPIPPQMLTVELTPETFVRDIAFARTFVLHSEVEALRTAGYGARVTERDLLVYGPHGPIGNELRAVDECVRHKILDCVGDFALLGCDLMGHITAYKSGHRLNQQLACRIRETWSDADGAETQSHAA